MKHEPYICAGDFSDGELRNWLHINSCQIGGIDSSLESEINLFSDSTILQIEAFRNLLRARIKGLTSNLVHRTEDCSKKAQEQALLLSRSEQALDAALSAFSDMKILVERMMETTRHNPLHQ